MLPLEDALIREQHFRVHEVGGPEITRIAITTTYLVGRGEKSHLLLLSHVCFNTCTVSSTVMTIRDRVTVEVGLRGMLPSLTMT